MLIFRLVVGLLLVSSVLCFGVFLATGQVIWRRRCVLILKWTLIALVGFAAVILLERLTPLL
ncbi:MAG TPA: hypothetical protein VIW70_04190 [Rubrivivax sp.]|jgi:hypothetical protein